MKRLNAQDERVIVSGCLVGLPCSYDGKGRLSPAVKEMVAAGRGIVACPERLGGRPTPREATELAGGDGFAVLEGKARALTKSGEDVTDEFIRGAERTLELANKHGCRKAILKARSPSCGCGQVYDGTFSGSLTGGDGVATALLKREGIEVLTEEDI